MKTQIITALALVLFMKCYSQDVLTMKTGKTYQVKILEITDTEVRFKMYGNIEGPTYNINRNSFSTIVYENSTTEQLAVEETAGVSRSIVINGYNTATAEESSSFSSAITDENPVPPPAPPAKQKVTAGEVISTIFLTGLFALKVAAEVESTKCARNHVHSHRYCAR